MNATVSLGLIGSLVTLVLLFELLRRHRLREKYALFWIVVAVFTLAIALFPQILLWTSRQLGVEVPSNLLFFLASMVLLVISVQHSYELGRAEDRTRILAEEVGLLRLEIERLSARADRDGEDGPDTDPSGGR